MVTSSINKDFNVADTMIVRVMGSYGSSAGKFTLTHPTGAGTCCSLRRLEYRSVKLKNEIEHLTGEELVRGTQAGSSPGTDMGFVIRDLSA